MPHTTSSHTLQYSCLTAPHSTSSGGVASGGHVGATREGHVNLSSSQVSGTSASTLVAPPPSAPPQLLDKSVILVLRVVVVINEIPWHSTTSSRHASASAGRRSRPLRPKAKQRAKPQKHSVDDSDRELPQLLDTSNQSIVMPGASKSIGVDAWSVRIHRFRRQPLKPNTFIRIPPSLSNAGTRGKEAIDIARSTCYLANAQVRCTPCLPGSRGS